MLPESWFCSKFKSLAEDTNSHRVTLWHPSGIALLGSMSAGTHAHRHTPRNKPHSAQRCAHTRAIMMTRAHYIAR
jgi:hypothetical protein